MFSLVAYWEFNWGLTFFESIAAGALGFGLIAVFVFHFSFYSFYPFFLFFSPL